MPAARAVLALNGSHGQFLPGALIRDVPDDVVAIWVADGAARYETLAELAAPPAAAADSATDPEPTALDARRALVARAKQLGLPAGGKSDAIAAAIVAREAELKVAGAIDPVLAAAAAGDATEGGPATPADDPDATATGEAGAPPSGLEVPAGAVAELTVNSDGTAEARILAPAGSQEAAAFRAQNVGTELTPPAPSDDDHGEARATDEGMPPRPDPTPAPPETGTAPEPETASARPARSRKTRGSHPSGEERRG